MDITNLLYIQNAILLGGTIFAWVNFIMAIYNKCEACGTGKKNNFDAKCLAGAIFFTFGLAFNIIVLVLSA